MKIDTYRNTGKIKKKNDTSTSREIHYRNKTNTYDTHTPIMCIAVFGKDYEEY